MTKSQGPDTEAELIMTQGVRLKCTGQIKKKEKKLIREDRTKEEMTWFMECSIHTG